MNKKILYEDILKLAAIFSKEIDKNLATGYVENLCQYEEPELKAAFGTIIRTKKFFPKIAEIIELIEPNLSETDSAQILANNIVETVLRLGRYQVEKINDELSPQERYALMAIGGVESICNINIDQLGTVRAQLRNSCKASIAKNKIETMKVNRIESKRGMQKINFKGIDV